ncbi:MAG TPA: glycosyl hydrolase family 18 protein [Patescibacteria group bacterium]|nr:glycosyl hydrolase family 18 protein [Patescibacteria group bacterium]
MASGFPGSLTRNGGRIIIALLAVVVGGSGGWNASSPAVAGPAAGGTPAGALAESAPAARLASVASGAGAVDLSAFHPAIATAVADARPEAAPANAGLQPSIQYEEAERHANDRIAFTPGARVTVGFEPRASDRWAVGGGRPTALPGGRLDGASMRGQGKAQIVDRPSAGAGPGQPAGDPSPTAEPSPAVPDGGVDVPTETGPATPATNASFSGSEVTPSATSGAAVSSTGLRREIFGFLPYWQVNSSTLRLDYSKISTIAYFGVGADAAGNLQKKNADGTTTVGWSGWTSSKMTSIISAAHTNRTRVVLTVQSFGWNTSGLDRQKALLGSSTARLNLARQIAAAVRDRGADGVNLDFEPLASTYDAEFTALVRSVRAELDTVHAGYQLTFDTTGSIGNYPIEGATAPGGADAIFIMGYDYRTSASSPVGSIAPLSGTGYDIRDTVAAYTARVAPAKLILGVPYYGRAWSTTSDAVHAANTSSTTTGASTTVVYSTAADYLAQYGRRYEAAEEVAWTAYQRENCTTGGCVTSWRQLYVDDATALGAKYDLVNSYDLRGAGIWALGYDGTRPELWTAIGTNFLASADAAPPVAGVRTLAARQLNPEFTVTWTGRDDTAVASYDVEAATDGGPWTAWLNATTAASAVWPGTDNHAYAFRVRARDAKDNVSSWNVTSTNATPGSLEVGGFGLVRTDGLSKRTAADTSSTKVGTFSTGDLVAVVGGPTTADGYTWFQVRGPLTEWTAVNPTGSAVWVATGTSSSPWLSSVKAPNATRVTAAIGDLAFGSAGADTLGATAPAAAARTFSPNGDGTRDRLAIHWTNDRPFSSLVLKVFRADGSAAGSVNVGQLAAGARSFAWDGTVAGAGLADGRYLVTLAGVADGATFVNPTSGFNAVALASYGITIDTVAPVVTAAGASTAAFSPNGDGVLDTVTVSLTATDATGWSFSAAALSGTTVGNSIVTTSGSGSTASVAWDGRAAGVDAPDSPYRLTLAAADVAGNRVERTWDVRLDRTAPAITPTATPDRFSPNADGAADTTRLAWTSSEAVTGTSRIYRGTTLIRAWAIARATAGGATWNGTDSAGNAVPDGTYAWRVTGTDGAGNLTTRTTSIVVDRTLSTLRWSRGVFYPQDSDSLSATSKVTFNLKRSSTVSLAIYSGTTLIRTVWTNRTLSAGTWGWTWNGRNSAGALVARGAYQARVTATNGLGTTVLARTVLADAFRIVGSATALSAGQTLTLTLTSTEALRASPAVTVTQPGRSAVTRTATSLGSGKYRVTFTIAPGAAGTATIRVTGRDSANGLNWSTGAVTIR